jgi:hypothetical protein
LRLWTALAPCERVGDLVSSELVYPPAQREQKKTQAVHGTNDDEWRSFRVGRERRNIEWNGDGGNGGSEDYRKLTEHGERVHNTTAMSVIGELRKSARVIDGMRWDGLERDTRSMNLCISTYRAAW